MTQEDKGREIVWGPEIRVDGVRPEWLTQADVRRARLKVYRCDERDVVPNADPLGEWGWESVEYLRLPAEHPHYATLSHATASNGGEVGPEVVGEHDSDCGLLYEDGPDHCTCRDEQFAESAKSALTLTDDQAAVLRKVLQDVVARHGETWPEAVSALTLLRRSLDDDIEEAKCMALNAERDFVTPHAPERLRRLEKHLLAAIKRGRALEKEAGR